MDNVSYLPVTPSAEDYSTFKKANNMEQIVKALDDLRKDAVKNDLEEISVIINSAFEICYNTYYIMLRKGHLSY